ncbi:MAG: radical SAM protein [Bacteroidetes bacterium]|nr:radical SAM protein [Bacteroidota bacterium]
MTAADDDEHPGNIEFAEEFAAIENCAICPRECGIDRIHGDLGWCRTGPDFTIASIGSHHGEEPVISGKSGICNIFFTHCNLQCIFCQNHQISSNEIDNERFKIDYQTVLSKISTLLSEGCHAVGFVSPSHVVPQVKMIIAGLNSRGFKPVYVYNSNGYDEVETLKELEGKIDVYLPDLKYMDASLSARFSQVIDYPEVAALALKEMYRQKGSVLIINDEGVAVSGLVIRHLVLPGEVENSKKVLRFIAEELSVSVHLSLMSQYYPSHRAFIFPELGRKLYPEEYEEVIKEMESLGFERGWVQAYESSDFYRPDFEQDDPFRQGV